MKVYIAFKRQYVKATESSGITIDCDKYNYYNSGSFTLTKEDKLVFAADLADILYITFKE